jgi:hypothetical protein
MLLLASVLLLDHGPKVGVDEFKGLATVTEHSLDLEDRKI